MSASLIEGFYGPGAVFMYAIAAILAYGIAVVLERAYLFWFHWKLRAPVIQELLQHGELLGAAQESRPHPVSTVIDAAVAADPESVWDAMATAAPLVQQRIGQRLDLLAAAGNLSTMLGLLGTVYGLIIALGGLDQASALERTAQLSEGIATAMTTTAWGLVVGVPVLAAHAMLAAKRSRIIAQCEAISAQLAVAKKHGGE